MIFYYLIYVIAASISFICEKRARILGVIVLTVILALFAGTRLDIDNDYHMYLKNLLYVEDSLSKFNSREISLEYSMYFLPNFFELFISDNTWVARNVFLTFAIIGVSTKMLAIEKYSDYFFLSVVMYISYLYFMMEMTTVRAGVAAGFFLLSIKYIEERKNKVFFIFLALCFLFHSSSILFLFAWLLKRFSFSIRYYYIAIVLSLLSALFKINIITLLFLDKIFPRVDTYIKAMEWMKEEDANIFNFKVLFALLMVVAFALFYSKLKAIKYFDILFKIHLLSIIVFFIMSTSAQVFSIRSFELLSVGQIILYPMIVKAFHPKFKVLAWSLVFIFSLVQLYYIISVADIYKPYKSWFF